MILGRSLPPEKLTVKHPLHVFTYSGTISLRARNINLVPPLNTPQWIEESHHQLRPPVGNQILYDRKGFIVMLIGGPNEINDHHINETEVCMFQITMDTSKSGLTAESAALGMVLPVEREYALSRSVS